jgi:hypothetical protein
VRKNERDEEQQDGNKNGNARKRKASKNKKIVEKNQGKNQTQI